MHIRFEIEGKMKKNQLWSLVIERSVDLVSSYAQMMFKYDLDHLKLHPGLPWMFAKSEQTHILRDGHCIVTIPVHSVW